MHEYRDEELATALSELPVPPTSADFFSRLHARLSRPRRLRRRPPVAAAALVGAALVAGGFGGAELAGSTRAASTPVTSFQPALGWNTFETNVLADPTQPNVAWAANVPFKPGEAVTPINTIKSLPPDGIVIVVVGPGPTAYSEPFLSLPPELSDFHFFSDNYEGQWAPNVSDYYLAARVSGTEDVDIEVWMGRNDPTPAMTAAADEELARLMLPS